MKQTFVLVLTYLLVGLLVACGGSAPEPEVSNQAVEDGSFALSYDDDVATLQWVDIGGSSNTQNLDAVDQPTLTFDILSIEATNGNLFVKEDTGYSVAGPGDDATIERFVEGDERITLRLANDVPELISGGSIGLRVPAGDGEQVINVRGFVDGELVETTTITFSDLSEPFETSVPYPFSAAVDAIEFSQVGRNRFSILETTLRVGDTEETSGREMLIPFSIEADLSSATEIFTTLERISVSEADSVKTLVPAEGFTTSFIYDASGRVIGADVVINSRKESLTFNASNSAKADVMISLSLTGLPLSEFADSYDSIERHPEFPNLLALYEGSTNALGSEEAASLSALIAIDLYETFAATEIDTQQVPLNPFSDGSGFELGQDPDDLRKLTVTGDDVYLDWRFFVLEGEFEELNANDLASLPSVDLDGLTYLTNSDVFGLRPLVSIDSFNLDLNVPENDCKVYTLAASAFAGPPDSDTFFTDNAGFSNFSYLVDHTFTIFGSLTAGFGQGTAGDFANFALEQAYLTWTVTGQGTANIDRFAAAVNSSDYATAAEVLIDTIQTGAETAAELLSGEDAAILAADFILDGDPAAIEIVKLRLKRILGAQAVFGVAEYSLQLAKERSGRVSRVTFATGFPEVALSEGGEINLGLDMSESGEITLTNTGCRDLDFLAGHDFAGGDSGIYDFSLETTSGIVAPGAQTTLPYSLTCFDIEGQGVSVITASAVEAPSRLNDSSTFDVNCGLARIEIDVSGLYNLPDTAVIRSVVQGDLSGQPDRAHSPTDSTEVYIVDPGVHQPRIGVLNGDEFLVLGAKRSYELAAGQVVRWAPTATANAEPKPTYDGPAEDCDRLQGIFTFDLNLFEDEQIDIQGASVAMYIDDAPFNLLGGQVLSDVNPLRFDGRTVRNCNVTLGQKGLGFSFDTGFFEDTEQGVFAYVEGNIDNLDNRWPTYSWNRTDLTANPELCPPLVADIRTTGVAGEPVAPQFNLGISAGEFGSLLASFQTTYLQEFNEANGRGDGETFISAQFSPNFIDSKFSYNGTEQWVHTVGAYAQPECDGGLGSSTLGVQSRNGELEITPLFTPMEDPRMDGTRPSFDAF